MLIFTLHYGMVIEYKKISQISNGVNDMYIPMRCTVNNYLL